ncbi:hypothetical protein NC653_009691 [Populus alba x Populus x berolinensis]|uniref:Uncharacterized protein n=1 Tax=Populus alba x Populus x berolinensis TaxID=444605 RepID=A0AAD6RAY4_9ROSI|nr:hypothetical protein NC653_009691 [Populus alba x Populus x berolinensis]
MVIESGLCPSSDILKTNIKAALANPFCAYPEIIVFQQTKSLSGILSNMLYASLICLHFAYMFTTPVIANKFHENPLVITLP